VGHIGSTRLSATLVCGADRYDHPDYYLIVLAAAGAWRLRATVLAGLRVNSGHGADALTV
jgi:hypothetical protein